MKALVRLLILAALVFGAYKLWEYYDRARKEREASRPEAIAGENGEKLPGLAPGLEASLQQAKAQGAEALKMWIEQQQKRKALHDPRLAWIELDYVVLVYSRDPVEARKVFAAVKQRLPPESPVCRRIKVLEKTYE